MVFVKKMALPGQVARVRSRRGALLSSVFLGIGAGSIGMAAFANDAAIDGVDCPTCVLADGRISVSGWFSEVDINVDTAPIGAAGAPVAGVGVYAFSTEDITVTATQDITTTSQTIFLDSNSITPGQGDITVTSSGALTSTLSNGVEVWHPLADLLLDGQSTGTIEGALRGVSILGWPNAAGTLEIRDFESIIGGTTSIYIDNSYGADIVIQGIGQIGDSDSSIDGIRVDGGSSGGNVLITDNGAITGGDDGIEAYVFGDGTMTINISDDVTGDDFGIYTRATDGDTVITVDAGTVDATFTTGIDSLSTGTGDTMIDIGSAGTVQGRLFGLVTGSGTGEAAAVVNNAGLIRNSADDLSPTSDSGAAFWSWTGSTIVNNEGIVAGGLHSNSGGSLTFNNLAGGEWYAATGDNPFRGTDTVNNAGTIFIRDGVTTFLGLDNFVTTSGGHVDMTFGTAATNTLRVLNFSTQAGALLSFDFDAEANNNAGIGYDNSDDGLGTADTIHVFGTATPEAGTLVSVNHINGDPKGLAGSVALVYTGVNLDAPDPGDKITSSDLYVFAAPQRFAATAFYLVDDGEGGLYYQWVPNISSASMGGYGGGDTSDRSTVASNIANAAAPFAGLGGLGSFGGGATGAITSSALASVRGADPACQNGQSSRFWSHADGTSTSGRGFKADSSGVTFGYEHDLGAATGQNCGQLVGGIFAGVGRANLSWGTGASKSSNVTTGAYLRYASTEGFYASGVVAVSRAKADLSNAIFGSTAKQKSVGYAGLATVGYVMPVSASGSIDWQASLSNGVVNGKSFTDSIGIEVDSTKSRLTTAGVSVAYWHQFDETTRGFIGAGVNWTEAKRETKAFGVKVDGTSTATIGTISAGLSSMLSDRSSLDVAIHSAFSDTATSIGGSIGFKLAF